MKKRKETIIETHQVQIIWRRKAGTQAGLDRPLMILRPAPAPEASKETRLDNSEQEGDGK